MWKISSTEKQFLQDGVAQNMRNDGRSNFDYRAVMLETGIISQTNGSARAKLVGNPSTDVLVGVKLEIGEPPLNAPNHGVVHFSVECSPSASPEFEGRGGEALNSELASMLSRTMMLNLSELCIIPVDSFVQKVLDSGGNLFDAISIATRAALANTEVPKMDINMEAKTFEVNEDSNSFTHFNTDNLPICVTFCKIGKNYVVDSSLEEELCMSVRITTAVNKTGHLCGIEKGGVGGGLDPSSLKEMLQSAKRIGVQLLEKLDAAIAEESKSKKAKIGFFL